MKIGLDPLEALVLLFGQAALGGFHLAEESRFGESSYAAPAQG